MPPALGDSYVSIASWSFLFNVIVINGIIVAPVFVVWCVDGAEPAVVPVAHIEIAAVPTGSYLNRSSA